MGRLLLVAGAAFAGGFGVGSGQSIKSALVLAGVAYVAVKL